jgi:diguanylate cyclase (GGDEF)-like protein
MTEEVLEGIYHVMMGSPQGFAVSKISASFSEHQDAIEFFGVDEVCSFVAVPFMKNGCMTSLLITYVRMKDNWHSSIERYMLNDDDLRIYRLLFMELEHAINRMEANAKVYEMNRKLQEAAVTDMLTGIYNRAGMYEEIHRMAERISASGKPQRVGLMFIDLDNFKHYNDTYGHTVGDLVLQEMAAIFRDVADGRGFVSRFGGDEFILILNTDERPKLEEIAREIYRRIEKKDGFKEQIEEHMGHEIEMNREHLVTCSIGIAQAGNVRKEEDINQLISKADDLLYSVKTGEKGHYAFL